MNVGTIVEFIESMIKSTTISNAEGAYGGGMSGAPFDPISFIKKPQVILRIVTLLFAVIVFGCIAAEDNYQNGTCPFNEDGTACGLGISIGVLAFLGCLAFLIIDARFDNFSNIKTRKRAVIVDLAFSGFMSFIWFITFCYLANEWRKTGLENVGVHKVQASIAFSFFSIITWAMMCLLNYLRYRQGISPAFTSGGYEEHNQADNQNFEAPYSNQMMTNSSSGYQQNTY